MCFALHSREPEARLQLRMDMIVSWIMSYLLSIAISVMRNIYARHACVMKSVYKGDTSTIPPSCLAGTSGTIPNAPRSRTLALTIDGLDVMATKSDSSLGRMTIDVVRLPRRLRP